MDNGKAVSNGKLGRLRLTKSEVDKLSGPESGYINYMDEHMPGFGVRVTAAGVKTYFLERRVRGSKRRISIGRAGDISAEFARKQAKVLAGQIAAGMDPVAERTRHKLETIKLEEALGHYIKEKDLKPRTISDMEKAFEESFSDWQKKELTKITRAMVKARYLQRVEKSKARANVAFRYLRAVYNWAIAEFRDAEERPILKDNPVSFLSEQKLWHKVARRRTVLAMQDLKSWVPAIHALAETPEREPGEGNANRRLRHGDVFRDLLLFLALTGCRKGEALALRAADVDFRRNVLLIRDPKNRTPLELPIQGELREILKRRVAGSKSDLVFGSPFDGRSVSNIRYAVERVTQETGLHFAPHDLRRLAASSLERLGTPTYTVKAVLNHLTGAADVTGGYVQVDLSMKREALTRLETFILSGGDLEKARA